jgi:isoamylase
MESRIDFYPTHTVGSYKMRPGKPFPFGATLVPGGVNFSIFSKNASACTLVIYEKHAVTPAIEIPVPDSFRIGNTWCMIVFDLDYEGIEYGYRIDGPHDPGAGHRFDSSKILLDPYARAVGGRDVWGKQPNWNDQFPFRGRLVFDDFDWEDDRALEIPIEDLVIYELHVRSFTCHESSGVKHPGTYAGLLEKIPYLKELGVNCVELMPVFEFDEFENSRQNPETGETQYNYWGYSTVGFFAPKAGFAATGTFGMQVDEFKNLIKKFHDNGIEVMLDVVFNHTSEGNEKGPTVSFRGVDNKTYYMLTPEGYYYNFSGCGNTLNCNDPNVRNMVVDCLRYWASEYHIDGFRFDLAAILGRDPLGAPLANPPLLESLAFDPVLGRCKLIAEAWDAGGLYQVGSFPAYGRWAEWNGKYRDDLRKFLKGESDMTGAISQRIQGSPDLYGWNGRGPTASINFITCHDGFTLRDLFSYNEKHNDANGEGNRDGDNDNHSWNCGIEGDTDDPGVLELRERMTKNAAAIILISHGIPMIAMGDEIGRTQNGNNNTYCHDNYLNWINWSFVEKYQERLRFYKHMIAFRHSHGVLRTRNHFWNADRGGGYPDISWHGTQPWQPDWSGSSQVLAVMFCGLGNEIWEQEQDPFVYVAMNSYWDGLPFNLPQLPVGKKWRVFANTAMKSPDDIYEQGSEPCLDNQKEIIVGGRSVVVLVGR